MLLEVIYNTNIYGYSYFFTKIEENKLEFPIDWFNYNIYILNKNLDFNKNIKISWK